MQVVEKSVLVAHTPAQMFALVDDIEHYSRFLPWCGKAEVLSREGDQVVASLHIDYLKVKQHFTTRNTNQAGEAILMELVDGPFEHLEGRWRFLPLGEIGCKVEFRLSYQFSSKILEMIIGPVFGHISGTLVDAFIKEADKVYGDD
ncbi:MULTISPECIES: type II toxin-antitoxin system RatA family toxin [Chromobacterium]|uniref:Type II toxin-antitoxin system RatA family toxin n=2 Tax=Chromobacterium TaxID=535 RepID=A0A1W0DAX1_9NEIS|nr:MULTISPECIES: type II toxin-antitoxin system RatA family toxin [Chromobacterium]AXT45544.1 type II toxin-antitoxin system RatA family toxin [Chromobacterium rhizoryzae]MBK0414470.1 type II toxin-antitoxin system RatA family toxin [Chromobacterium haemolyticum]MBO0415896.1 type II toxin-antitoxin system RatA family toxin [Chromobacterium haemolyticum]MBO0499156.1 type II toxin-antitoxin system RatA family toxin [Chromobacterium haemolyticum]MDH0342883.1 type II toxin-antitoxin system RatA fa